MWSQATLDIDAGRFYLVTKNNLGLVFRNHKSQTRISKAGVSSKKRARPSGELPADFTKEAVAEYTR